MEQETSKEIKKITQHLAKEFNVSVVPYDKENPSSVQQKFMDKWFEIIGEPKRAFILPTKLTGNQVTINIPKDLYEDIDGFKDTLANELKHIEHIQENKFKSLIDISKDYAKEKVREIPNKVVWDVFNALPETKQDEIYSKAAKNKNHPLRKLDEFTMEIKTPRYETPGMLEHEVHSVSNEEIMSTYGIDSLLESKNKGLMSGETMNKKMKKEMYHGGMMMPEMIVGIDEVSGNEIPPGSDAENVRDDIPAALSEGELVIPADVVRYHGLKAYEDMRMEAKMGLMSMMAEGQIVSLDEEESEEEYDEDYEMNPTDHVEKNEDTGMYCVYDNDGNKVKEFKTKKEANEYAKQNHDELMASSNVEEVEVSVEEEGMDLKEDSEGVKAYPTEKDDLDMMEVGDNSIIKLFVKGLMGR